MDWWGTTVKCCYYSKCIHLISCVVAHLTLSVISIFYYCCIGEILWSNYSAMKQRGFQTSQTIDYAKQQRSNGAYMHVGSREQLKNHRCCRDPLLQWLHYGMKIIMCLDSISGGNRMMVCSSKSFTVPSPTDGSLSEETWFNNKQLCTEPSTERGIATPAETLKANLGEVLWVRH